MKKKRKRDHALEYFVRKHGITAAQARSLIDKIGNDRRKLDKTAAILAKR